MIIKAEPAIEQDPHDIQPPPPEYTETLVRPEPTHIQQPPPAAQLHYPPQPSPRNRDSPTTQQPQTRVGQEYRDRCKPPLRARPNLLNSQHLCSVSPMRKRRTRCNHDIWAMRHHLCRPVVSNRPGVSVVSLRPPMLLVPLFRRRLTSEPFSQQRR